jgi:hypothetical protein
LITGVNRMAAGVKVRGSCSAGHITEAVAEKGRATWNGVCSVEGCGRKVTAKRVPRDRVPPAPPASDPAGGNSREQYPFIEVHSYDELGDDSAGGLSVEPDDDNTGEPAGGDPAEGAAAEGVVPDPVDDDADRRPRWRRGRSDRGDWQHPLL